MADPRVDSRPNIVMDPRTIELIEKVVYDEAGGESLEGRNAVRAVIYNRIATNRRDFGGGTALGVLNAPKQFTGVMQKGNGDARNLRIPDDIREKQLKEHIDFLQKGEDPTNGATFFQNPQTAANRYAANGGQRIGRHVFYDNYAGNKVAVPDFKVSLKGLRLPEPKKPVVEEENPLVELPDEPQSPFQGMASTTPQVEEENPLVALEEASTTPFSPLQGNQQAVPDIVALNSPLDDTPKFNKGGMLASKSPSEDEDTKESPKLFYRNISESPNAAESLENVKTVADVVTDFVPVVGEAKSAYNAYTAFNEGNYGEAGLNALGAVPFAGVLARGAKAVTKAVKGKEVFEPLLKVDTPDPKKSTSKTPEDSPKVADELSESFEEAGKALAKSAPTSTVKAYKLFRTNPNAPGELFPLFVNADKGVPVGAWVDAEVGPLSAGGKVKSKIGDLAYRPGWHAGDHVAATHIGGKTQPGLTKPDYRPANQVWAEVELPNDVNWQAVADSRASIVKSGPNKGQPNVKEAHITDQVPEGGFYRYKTNSNMQGSWLIGGSMKVNRPLSLDEAKKIQTDTGISDLPTLPEVIDQKKLKLKDLNQEAVKELKAFYPDKFTEMSGPKFNAGGLLLSRSGLMALDEDDEDDEDILKPLEEDDDEDEDEEENYDLPKSQEEDDDELELSKGGVITKEPTMAKRKMKMFGGGYIDDEYDDEVEFSRGKEELKDDDEEDAPKKPKDMSDKEYAQVMKMLKANGNSGSGMGGAISNAGKQIAAYLMKPEDSTATAMPIEMYKGGMMAPEIEITVEEESGNPVPPGSLPEEVADDVPVMMSEGEVVLPADVVRWHGLKHIMEMRAEAKHGLMCMYEDGQIQVPGEEGEEEESEEMDEEEEVDNEEYLEMLEDLVGDEELITLYRKDGTIFKK